MTIADENALDWRLPDAPEHLGRVAARASSRELQPGNCASMRFICVRATCVALI